MPWPLRRLSVVISSLLCAALQLAAQSPGEGFAETPRGTAAAQLLPPAAAETLPGNARFFPALNEQSNSGTNTERAISWKLLVPNVLHDQKPIWLFPARAARGKNWEPTLAFVLMTADLVAVDPHEAPYFRRTQSFHDFNRALSGRNTAIATVALPLGFYAFGLARKDSYAERTALYVGEAVADSELLTLVMKNIDRRLRPSDIAPDGDFSHTWFRSHGRFLGGRGSFPSGHTIAAFSVATVFSERYRHRCWVPWVAYGLAGLVGFSRVTLQSHFPSDVFAGAVLGYTMSRYVVLRER